MYIGENSPRPAGSAASSSLPPFAFGSGYSLKAFDLGNAGVKLELHHDGDTEAAIILPPREVGSLGRWLLNTLGQDKHGLPVELGGILERLTKPNLKHPILERGDKKRIKEALRTLRS